MNDTAWPHPTPLRRYSSLDSTNEEARRLSLAGETGPLWILARRQSAGRGRRGASWVSQAGNLFATLLTPVVRPLETCAQLSFVAALSVGDLVADCAPAARVTLKWPNDVLADGRKIAGILLEAASDNALAIGIGVNLVSHPELRETAAISLAALKGSTPSPEAALARLAGHWDKWYEAWKSCGFAPLREAWLARAAGLGERIVARGAENDVARDVEGVFENLDRDGALLIRRANGALIRITAGDVFFRN